MPWRLRVNHLTRYTYAGTVTTSYNEARMTPLSLVGQTAVDARLEVRPAVRTYRYWDYWGTMVHAFDLHQPHDELTVTASSVVETNEWRPITDLTTWEALTSEAELDRWCELLSPSRYVPGDDALAARAARLRSARRPGGGADPLSAAVEANRFVHEHMAYRKGSTTVATSAPEAFSSGSGVCQDFAHVLLGILRSMGIPSRYVSGYLYGGAESAASKEPEEITASQSHAWVEAWVGDWLSLDPTHGGFTGPQHVIVARGRDYDDVTPLKGIFTGAPLESLQVEVELTRIA
jgi:transglutaminase-like putative cysteine protease